MENKNIWVVLNRDENSVHPHSIELLGKAAELGREMNEEVVGVVIGFENEKINKEAFYYGASKVISVDSKVYEEYSTEGYTHVLSELIDKYNPYAILIPATHNGRDLGGRICARKNLGLVADCVDIVYSSVDKKIDWVRPSFDGKLFSNIRITTTPEIGTVGSKVFKGNKKDESRSGEVIEENIDFNAEDIGTKILEFIKSETKKSNNLQDAEIVVAGGLGLGSKENWHLIDELAEALGAATACTKPLVDNGWFDKSMQVGSSGARVSPKIYIAVGISGSLQHVAGMKKSNLIIAINNDKEAPIFQNAHYAMVGDLFEIVPELTEAIKNI